MSTTPFEMSHFVRRRKRKWTHSSSSYDPFKSQSKDVSVEMQATHLKRHVCLSFFCNTRSRFFNSNRSMSSCSLQVSSFFPPFAKATRLLFLLQPGNSESRLLLLLFLTMQGPILSDAALLLLLWPTTYLKKLDQWETFRVPSLLPARICFSRA